MHESHKTNRPFELDKDIDIALGVLLAMHYRAKDTDPDNTEFRAQLIPAFSDALDL
jgi:hypothetical protein